MVQEPADKEVRLEPDSVEVVTIEKVLPLVNVVVHRRMFSESSEVWTVCLDNYYGRITSVGFRMKPRLHFRSKHSRNSYIDGLLQNNSVLSDLQVVFSD